MDDEERPPSTPARGQGAPSSAPRRSARTRREDRPSATSSGGGEASQNTSRTPRTPRRPAASTSAHARAHSSSASPQRRESTPIFTPRAPAGSLRGRVARPSLPPPEIVHPEALYSEAESIDFPEAILPAYDPTASTTRKKQLSKAMAQERIRPWKSPVKIDRERKEREERERREAQRKSRRRPAPGQEVFDEDGLPCAPATPAPRRRANTTPSSEIIEIQSTDDENPTPTRPTPHKRKPRQPPRIRTGSGNVIELETTTAEEDAGPATPTNDEPPSTRRSTSTLKRKRPTDKKRLPPRKRARADSVDEVGASANGEGDLGRPGTPPPLTDAEDFLGASGDVEMGGDQAFDEMGTVDLIEETTMFAEPAPKAEVVPNPEPTPCEPEQRGVSLGPENVDPTGGQDWFNVPPETEESRLTASLLFDEALALIAQEDATDSPADTAPTSSADTGAADPALTAQISPPLRGPGVPSSPVPTGPTFPTSPASAPARRSPAPHPSISAPSRPIISSPLRPSSAAASPSAPPRRPAAPHPSLSAPPRPARPVLAPTSGSFYERQLRLFDRAGRNGAVLRPAVRAPPAMVGAKHADGREERESGRSEQEREGGDTGRGARVGRGAEGAVTGRGVGVVMKAEETGGEAEQLPAESVVVGTEDGYTLSSETDIIMEDPQSPPGESRPAPQSPPSQSITAPPTPPPPRTEAKPPDTVPNSQAPTSMEYTPPLSPTSDSTLGASPPTLYVTPGTLPLPLPVAASVVKQVDDEDFDFDFNDLGGLQYPSKPES
ncbi:hypothetical protein DFH09DRAFT_1163363 [Mycena vulgaris]|nr:hypothetical protein DFH09DRAFT_1163363 [Mycena vulgaris]